VSAQKGDMRIDKTSKNLASICCPQCSETKADTLKVTEANRRRGPGSKGNVRFKKEKRKIDGKIQRVLILIYLLTPHMHSLLHNRHPFPEWYTCTVN
jgi:hypothetical protein